MEYFLKWIDAKIAAIGCIPGRLWGWIDGKKTVLSALYWWAIQALIPIWFPSGVPDPWDKVLWSVGSLLTMLGFGHKAVKGIHKAAGGSK